MFEYIESACDDTLWKALSEIDDELKEFLYHHIGLKNFMKSKTK